MTSATPAAGTLATPRVATTLDRLHTDARGDWRHLIGVAPTYLRSVVTRQSFMRLAPPSRFANAHIAVSRAEGRFLYTLARASGARRIVEFGASFGVSTIYLAAAARDNGGMVITSELEPAKCRATAANLHDAGLAATVEVREGDALETLASVEGPVDLVFLDGWKDLYLPILRLLRPKLRPGGVVVADNVNLPDTRAYVEHVRSPDSGFASCTLFGRAVELSVLAGSTQPVIQGGR